MLDARRRKTYRPLGEDSVDLLVRLHRDQDRLGGSDAPSANSSKSVHISLLLQHANADSRTSQAIIEGNLRLLELLALCSLLSSFIIRQRLSINHDLGLSNASEKRSASHDWDERACEGRSKLTAAAAASLGLVSFPSSKAGSEVSSTIVTGLIHSCEGAR